MIEIRVATRADERRLAALDRVTWSPDVSPVPRWSEGRDFFARDSPDDVIVAAPDGNPVGYVTLCHPTPLVSNRHVLQIGGLAVDPSAQRQGVGRSLVHAAVHEATARGARRLTLRVLGSNDAALALYASCDFVVEGTLPRSSGSTDARSTTC